MWRWAYVEFLQALRLPLRLSSLPIYQIRTQFFPFGLLIPEICKLPSKEDLEHGATLQRAYTENGRLDSPPVRPSSQA